MNYKMFSGLTQQEAKSSKSFPLKFSFSETAFSVFVKVTNQPKYFRVLLYS